ncbi:MAG TPA: hypothetical protein EYN91_12765 [Candidatus Melainabacteria bacterium]|nr:hypothetical protein [Candidatus Melainabacteria bacterium]
MDLSFFTRRYVDRSKNTGFQFEFFCDRCNKGHLTPFRIHALGVVTSIWDATDWKKEKEKEFDFDTLKKDVSKLFLKGKAWIEAYTNAVEEAQKYFKHCARCLKWVCPKECFNSRANLCQGCAPLTEAEKAALQAEERRKSSSKTAEPADAPRICPHCGKSNPVATFCADCGKKVVQDIFCSSCGAKWSTEKKMKYCPRCGDEMPELTFRTKPTVVKSEAEKHVDMAVDTIVDLGSEVKKVAEEYKKVAEDIFGFTPKGRESAKSTPPQAKAPKSGSSHPEANKSDSRNSNATEPDRTVAHSEMENGENTGSAEAEDTKGPGVKSKTQTRKKTKIAKSKKQIKGKKPVSAKKPVSVSKPAQKKNAPATKKPKPQPKAKAKKKSRPKT